MSRSFQVAVRVWTGRKYYVGSSGGRGHSPGTVGGGTCENGFMQV